MKETADARSRLEEADAMRLAKAASRIIVAKASKVVEFDMKHDPPKEGVLLTHLLGPTGNLRAPAIRVGRTLVVGFNDGVYGEALR